MRNKFSLEKQGKFNKKNTKILWRLIFAVMQVPVQLGMCPWGCPDACPAGGPHPATHRDAHTHLKDSRRSCGMEAEALKLATGLQEWWVAIMCLQQASMWSLPPCSSQGPPGGSALARTLLTSSIPHRSWISTQDFSRHKESVQLGWDHLHTSSCIPLFFCCDGASQGFLPHHTCLCRALCLPTKVEKPKAFQSALMSLLMTYIISHSHGVPVCHASSTCFSFPWVLWFNWMITL